MAALCVAGAGLFAMAQSTHAQTLPYPPYNGTTLVVDDDKVQCPTAGYSTIQSAVDAASPGSTIHVCPGTYAEQVTITKPVQIYGDNGALMFRPEQIRIRAQPSDLAEGGLQVVVRDVTYLGDTMHYAVSTPWEQEIAVRTSISSREPSLAVGARAWLEWENESARVFAA